MKATRETIFTYSRVSLKVLHLSVVLVNQTRRNTKSQGLTPERQGVRPMTRKTEFFILVILATIFLILTITDIVIQQMFNQKVIVGGGSQ